MKTDFTKTIEHLEHFNSNIPPLLFATVSAPPNSLQWIAHGMLGRLYSASTTLSHLISNSLFNHFHDFSIGITLRACLLDALSALRIYALFKSTLESGKRLNAHLEDFNALGMSILADGFKYLLDQVKLEFEQGFVTNEDLIQFYDSITSNFGEFLHQPSGLGTKPTSRWKSDSTNYYYKALLKDHDIAPIARKLYQLYLHYSKYDHFSFMYFVHINQPKSEISDNIKASVSLLARHYLNLCDILQRTMPSNEAIKKQLNIAAAYVDSLQKK